ncbi:MAG TPA: metallophosphoesterase, partial [Polyangiaceae bacterium]|nr:metallophosphoesterase [Polyangiaceae bacterium]
MRLGILSDVHANYEALSAVVEAFKSENIDRYYCLGDTVGYGGSPNECSDVVRDLVEATILGNHDAAVAGRMDYSYYYEAARHALDLHAQLLSEENMRWLKGLPYQIKLEDINVNLCHGSPVRLEEFEYIFAPEQARECLPIYQDLGHLTLIGHSHLCKVFALTANSVEELPPIDFELQPDRKYIVSV